MPVSVFPSSSSDFTIKFPKKMFTPHSSISNLTIHTPHKFGVSVRSTLPTDAKPKNVFSGSASSNSPYAGMHFSKPSELTPQEAYALGYQQGHHSSSGSFLDNIKNDAGSVLDKTLNVLSRPNWGVVQGYDQATKHGGFSLSHFLEGFKQGAIDGKAENWGQLLTRRGDLKGHSFLRGAAGFGLDVLTDPTTYLFGAGAFAKTGEFAAVKGLSELEKGGALKILGREATVFPEAKTEAQAAAQQAHHVLEERLALQDVKNESNKYLELRFGITKNKSVGIQTPIRLRTAKNVRLAKMAQAGPLKSAVHGLVADFVPGYKDPLAHLVENHALHVAEMQGQRMSRAASDLLVKAARALPNKHDQMTALLAAVVPGIVRHGKLDHDLLEQELIKLGFKGEKLIEAKDFVEAYHHTGELLHKEDSAFGIQYKNVTEGEKGHVYVPHFYEKNNPTAGIVMRGGMNGEAGFAKGKKLTLEQALDVSKKGRSHLIDDPVALMQKRIEKGAVKQAHANVLMYMKQHFGVPSRVLKDPEGVAKAMARVHRLNGHLEGLQKQLEEHGTLGKKKAMFHRTRMAEVRKLQKEIRGLSKRDLATRTHQHAAYHEELKKTEGEILAVRHIKEVAKRPHTKLESVKIARLTRLSNHLKEKMAQTETEAAMRERHAQQLSDIAVQHEMGRSHIQAQIDQTVKELAKVEPAAIKKAFRKNPDLNHNLVPLTSLKETHSLNAMRAKLGDKADYTVKLNEAAALKESAKGMTVNYHVPGEIHDAVTRVEAVLNDPQRMGQVLKAFHKALSKWKLWVTMVNPGYGVRNTLSDLWNAFIRGVPLWAIVKYAGRAAQVMKAAHDGDAKALSIIREAGYQGILTGFFKADIKTALKGDGAKLNPARIMTDANITRENLGRLMHYLYRREHQGMSPAAAANEVKIAHFDYEDLTPFEQRNLKAFIPFYTWTRKNVPLQIQSIIARPGRVNTYTKFASEEEQATGVSPGELATSVFQEHPLAFKTPLGYFDPNIGLSDLARITSPQQLSQMVSPFVTVPLQEATNLNFFTGQPLEGADAAHQLTPAPGFLSDLLGGGETGRMQPNGKYLHSPGISNRLALLVNSVPLGSEIMAHNPVTMDKKNVFGPLEQRDVSYGLGLSFTQPNQAQELFVQEYQAQKDQQAALKAAREAGGYPAAQQPKQSAFEKRMERLIKKQMGR